MEHAYAIQSRVRNVADMDVSFALTCSSATPCFLLRRLAKVSADISGRSERLQPLYIYPRYSDTLCRGQPISYNMI